MNEKSVTATASGDAIDFDQAGRQCFVDVGPCGVGPGPVDVPLALDGEFERVAWAHRVIPGLEATGIGQEFKALSGRQSEVVRAARTDMLRTFELTSVNQVAAGRALAPDVIGHALMPVVRTTGTESRLTPKNQFSHDEIAGPSRHNPSSDGSV